LPITELRIGQPMTSPASVALRHIHRIGDRGELSPAPISSSRQSGAASGGKWGNFRTAAGYFYGKDQGSPREIAPMSGDKPQAASPSVFPPYMGHNR